MIKEGVGESGKGGRLIKEEEERFLVKEGVEEREREGRGLIKRR